MPTHGQTLTPSSLSSPRFMPPQNVPKGVAGELRGFYLAHQGQHCHFPYFKARCI